MPSQYYYMDVKHGLYTSVMLQRWTIFDLYSLSEKDQIQHQIAGQIPRYWGPCPCWNHSNAIPVALGWPRCLNARPPASQETLLWGIRTWQMLPRWPKEMFQGHPEIRSSLLTLDPAKSLHRTTPNGGQSSTVEQPHVKQTEWLLRNKSRSARRSRALIPLSAAAICIPCPRCSRSFRVQIGLFSHLYTHHHHLEHVT